MTGSRSRQGPHRALPFSRWPERDRAAWNAALRPGDVLDPGGIAARWSAASRRKTALGYGHFLSWLESVGRLDRTTEPGARVTRAEVSAYLVELKRTVRGHTVQCRIQELGDAMRALAPDRDWGWILRAAGRLQADTIPAVDKAARLRPVQEIVAEAFRLMDEAEGADTGTALDRAVLFRDALMIAFLGFHPMRLRNFAALRVGRHLIEQDDGFLVCLGAHETKGRQAYEAPLAEALSGAMRRYLTHHRLVLLTGDGRRSASPLDALWVSLYGTALNKVTIDARIRKRTGGAGRQPLSPHLFRSCAATSLAVHASGSVDIIPALLGHGSPRVGERYYNLARSLAAVRGYQDVLGELRTELGQSHDHPSRRASNRN